MKEIQKYDYIDALRGIAVLMVLFVHTGMLFTMDFFPHWFKVLQSSGARGVQLFFILSALTLFLSYRSRSSDEVHPDRNFFIRRLFRIAPLYYIAIAAGLLFFGLGARYWLGDMTSVSVGNIMAHFAFLSGLSPYYMNSVLGVEWSVGVEMLFYLVLPFLARKVKNALQTALLFIGSILVIVPFNYLLDHKAPAHMGNLWHDFVFLSIWNQFPVFIIGIFLYFVLIKNERMRWYIYMPAVLFFLLSFLNGRFIIYAFGIGFALLTVFVKKTNTPIIVNKFFVFIGKISYSMYLVHIFVVTLLLRYLKPVGDQYQNVSYFLVYYIALIGATAAVSFVTYHSIEKKGITLGKRLIEQMERVSPTKQNPAIDSQTTPL